MALSLFVMSRALQIYIFLVITACAHESRRDSLDYLRTLKGQDPAATSQQEPADEVSQEIRQQWSLYLQAKSQQNENPTSSCEAFYGLSQDEDFKIKDLAFLRALSVCPADYAPLQELELTYGNFKGTYLDATALEALIQRFEKTGKEAELMELYYERSKHQTLQSEKLESMDKALALAKKLKLPSEVKAYTARIERIAPRRIPNPQWQDLYKVAQDYRQARMFPEAVEAYQKYMRHRRAGPHEGYEALRGLRELRRLTRNENQELYLTSTRNLARFTERMFKNTPRSPWVERHHAMSVQWARTLWTYGRRDEAVEVLKSLSGQLQGKHSLAQIYWLRSRIELEKGELSSSMKWLERAQKEKITDTSLQEDIYWDVAWGHRKQGELERALVAFEELEKNTTQESQRFKSMFWRAKTLSQMDKERQAQKVYRELAEEDVLGYYGQLAYHEMGRPLPTLPSDPSSASAPAELEWLLAVEEQELALSYVQHLWTKRTKSGQLSQKETLELLQLFARCGEFLDLFRYFATLPPDEQKVLIRENYGLLFPQSYKADVTRASLRFGVPRELILSIIRQESAFNPQARSWADAFGLMQLLPGVGQNMASAHGIPLEDFEELYEPSTNILLGTALLHHLKRSHRDQFVIVVASYNASERAIYNWIRTRFRGDTLEFIEEIPYRETQGYVKLVLRNYVFYQRLLSDQKEIPFPSETLQGLGEIQAGLSQNSTSQQN